jgi:hypothetical protein
MAVSDSTRRRRPASLPLTRVTVQEIYRDVSELVARVEDLLSAADELHRRVSIAEHDSRKPANGPGAASGT